MDEPTIRTERLLLRGARMSDLADLHRVFSDPRAMRFWDGLPFDDVGQTERLLRGMLEAAPEEACDLVVERGGTAIGKAGCWRLGELGVILHPDHWGQGLAREALAAAIPASFARLPMDRIVADVDPRNAASLRLLTGLGFRETGRQARTVQVAGEWFDSVYLELRRPDPVRRGGP